MSAIKPVIPVEARILEAALDIAKARLRTQTSSDDPEERLEAWALLAALETPPYIPIYFRDEVIHDLAAASSDDDETHTASYDVLCRLAKQLGWIE